MACVIDFAKSRKKVLGDNIYRSKGAKFQYDNNPHDERKSYDKDDMQRLVNALCSEELGGYSPRPERFWIILIGIFTGFRLSNIVTLTKDQIRCPRKFS